MESVREHFLFSMQKLFLILKLVFSKIHVTGDAIFIDQEFWGKLMYFWLSHVSSSCAWEAAPSALEEEQAEGEGVLELPPELWCQPGVSRDGLGAPPPSAAA